MTKRMFIGRITILILILLIGKYTSANANNLLISGFSVVSVDEIAETARLQCTISWENSWRDAVNYDAVWLFVKYSDGTVPWGHATLVANTDNDASIAVDISNDGLGAFIYRAQNGSGNVAFTDVQLDWDYGADGLTDINDFDINIYGIEMVHIPEGSFYAGDGETNAGSLYANFEDGVSGNPLQITSENALTLGGGTAGSLGNNNNVNQLSPALPGGCSGCLGGSGDDFNDAISQILPAAYPKGFQAFYIMKYEMTQQQWVDMLNTLTAQQQTLLASTTHFFVGFGVTSFDEGRYGISETGGVYSTTEPYIPMIYLDWIRAAAYGDWSGLRPMTELEFEKACRGPELPVASEFPWGNSNIATVGDFTLTNLSADNESITAGYDNGGVNGNCWVPEGDRNMVVPARVGIFAAHPDNTGRVTSGSTYYGVMEMGGNIWERAVSVGHPEGRAFTGNHGDGVLNEDGYADVADWPGGLAADGTINTNIGMGFRGGAFLFPTPDIGSNARTSSRRVSSAYYNAVIHDDGIRFVRTAN